MILKDIAVWAGPTPNETPGAEDRKPMGLILHIQQGGQAGSLAWCKNPDSQVSAHFFADRRGGLVQLVDTADAAWAEVAGNAHWISVECEGYSGQPLTGVQLQTIAILLLHLHQNYGVPLQVSDDPFSVPGLTGHSLGGAAYGGHYQCPGEAILDQRTQIIAEARALGSILEGADMQLSDTVEVTAGFAARYPKAGADGFTAGAQIPVSVLLMGAAIRAANNEHLLEDIQAQLAALKAAEGTG